MPSEICRKCNNSLEGEDKFLYCDCCRVVFHLSEGCSGLCSSEIRAVVLQKRNLLYLCVECRNAFKSAPMVVRKMQELQEEVTSLKKQIAELKSSPTVNTEVLLNEAHERHVRSKNIMVYDVQESTDDRLEDRIANDTNIANDIFMKLGCEKDKSAIVKVVRVGQKKEGKKRPIKIICSNSEIVRKALRSKKKLNKAYDCTKMQQDAYKAAKEELTQRNNAGEDLIIKYLKGVPS